MGVVNLGFMAFWGVLVLFARDVLHLGALGFGLLLSSVAIGGVVGSLVSERIARRLGRGAVMVGGISSS